MRASLKCNKKQYADSLRSRLRKPSVGEAAALRSKVCLHLLSSQPTLILRRRTGIKYAKINQIKFLHLAASRLGSLWRHRSI